MKFCFVIPNYNHSQHLDTILTSLQRFNTTIVMVDDGSDVHNKAVFASVAEKFENLFIVTHAENQGKGGAVQTGLKKALELGFDYAIQIDADGQHSLSDIDRLVSASKANPHALISGKPIYDESVPKHRFIGRYITHFWVAIETMGTAVKDTMCGFRVYPLNTVVKLINEVSLGKRMDFDIEVMVRLYWRGVDIKFIDTQVIYPEDGSSHFRLFHDNVEISWMHTRLVAGMLLRSPVLLWRKLLSGN